MSTPRLISGVLLVLALVACDSQSPADPVAEVATRESTAGAESVATVVALDAAVMQKWSRSCALCHVTGNAGAPRVGNAEEWQQRQAQGASVMLTHTIEGFNDMPPLGYCMSCEREDFVAMIDFMAGDTTGEMP
jgi:cytochrome c5